MSCDYLELLSEFLLLVLELVHGLLIPAPGLGLQVAGSTRDHTRLLEESAVQSYRLEREREREEWRGVKKMGETKSFGL